jgi:hypothetical protein
MGARWYWYCGVGAVSGLLSAAAVVFLHLGDVEAPTVAGYCFGMRVSSKCGGVDATLYLFPGAIFGILIGAMQLRLRRAAFSRACAFAGASWVANALAVFLCVWLTDTLGDLLNIDFLNLPMAIAGAIAGTAGGVSLGFSAKALSLDINLRRSIVAAAALGLLVPLVLMWEVAGIFIFFVVWQAGYAAALAANPAPQR